jgi:uncharacterized metal-binding protein YceD (DUF177 family)
MSEQEESLETRLVIDLARLDPDGEDLDGEVDIVDLDEPYVRPFGGVRYRLNAQVFGTELLVRGHLEQDFDLVCSRCGNDFDTTVAVDDFTVSIEISDGQSQVDLTDDVRECIILTLPTYPVCDEDCPGIAQKTENQAFAGCWSALDGLAVEESKKKK